MGSLGPALRKDVAHLISMFKDLMTMSMCRFSEAVWLPDSA